MRTISFREYLANVKAPPGELTQSADDEVFITKIYVFTDGVRELRAAHLRRSP
jgi:hypothetical protein